MRDLKWVRSLGLELRYVGRLDILPENYMVKLAALEVATSELIRRRKALTLTIEGSKIQMEQLALQLAKGLKAGIIQREDITAELIDECLGLAECPEADMLWRFAGLRFSDFVVPQCSYAYLKMERKTWEDVGFSDWTVAVLLYQLHWPSIAAVKGRHAQLLKSKAGTQSFLQVLRQRKFMVHIEASRSAYIAESLAKCGNLDTL
ncbi:isoprenyl transferase-like [Amblyomma americanum]